VCELPRALGGGNYPTFFRPKCGKLFRKGDKDQKAANRQLVLEIKDLTAYMKGQLVGLSLSDLRSLRQPDRPRQHELQKRRDFDYER
jgi:hypothetical protein